MILLEQSFSAHMPLQLVHSDYGEDRVLLIGVTCTISILLMLREKTYRLNQSEF